MNIEEIRAYCLSRESTSEDFPFDEDVLVFRTSGKIFALISLSQSDRINLKCDPVYAVELRDQFTAVRPGFHMNKKHWNTVFLNEDLEESLIYKLIDHSYECVVRSLSKSEQAKRRGSNNGG